MDPLEQYLRNNSTSFCDTLDWLERETHLRTNHARMLSGRSIGALLRHFVLLLKPQAVLELGVFTGYSTICLAGALPEGGMVDSIEINDEMEDLIREGLSRAGVEDKVNLIFGDAKEVLDSLDKTYDLVYIDANKREYVAYYQTVIDMVRPGGYILADNVLWDGKVYEKEPPRDRQTQGILAFNDLVAGDSRVENFILPVRDGINIIRKK